MGESTVRAYRDVLAVQGARALIGASAASQVGDWLYNAALLGYVYSATRSAGWVGAATICRLLPYVLLGPFGGALADRYPRRTVLLAGDALSRRGDRLMQQVRGKSYRSWLSAGEVHRST